MYIKEGATQAARHESLWNLSDPSKHVREIPELRTHPDGVIC